MSTNHYSSDQFPDAHLYCSYAHCLMESSSGHSNQKSTFFSSGGYWAAGVGGGGGSSSSMFNLNNEDEEELRCDEQAVNNAYHDGEGRNLMGMDQFGQDEREPLFEKPLTPSDVGKLNRLVIPKQHAERYFPISGGGGGEDPGEKGFILSFEDEMGKLWRFRYSYWNSSQSYVLTKGWSRFVKEKMLDAGDFVLFSRHRADCDRLFIGWRKRNTGQGTGVAQLTSDRGGGGGGLNRASYQGNPYPNQQYQGFSSQAQQYQQDSLHAGTRAQNQTRGGGNSRRVRLFGVNLECQADESDPSNPTDRSGYAPHNQHQYYSNHQNHTGWP